MEASNWVDIIKSVKMPISLIVLVTLIADFVLFETNNDIVHLGTLALLFIITISVLAYAIKNHALFPLEVIKTWNKDDLPLTKDSRESWLGKWNCR